MNAFERLVGDISSTIGLAIFGFKIVVLLFIVQFVRGRFGAGPLVTILIFILGYIMLFQYWMLFGPLMFVYLLVVFGFTGILFDLSIVRPWERVEMPEMGAGRVEGQMVGMTPEEAAVMGYNVPYDSRKIIQQMRRRRGAF